MESNVMDHPLKYSKEGGVSGSKELRQGFVQGNGTRESVVVEYTSSDEQSKKISVEQVATNSEWKQLISETSQSKELNVTPSPSRGLDHFISAPVSAQKRLLIDHDFTFSRSMTEKKIPRHELKLDRLSEREKQKLIVELVRIQNDGTVEVDIDESASVASELFELQTIEVPSLAVDGANSGSNKVIPRLKIAILVVGTRGDVQPFLAMARRLQQ